jgi:hypothetical protein
VSDSSTDNQSDASWRLRTYPILLLVTLFGAMLLAVAVYDQDDPTSRLGGDYPSFYGAGAIVNDGDWDDLYSGERQQAEQAGLIDDAGGYLYFSYPPFVAAAYGLLGGLDYRWSFLLHTILMGLALYGAVRLLAPWLRHLNLPIVAIFVAALAFYPVLRAIPGGQNTTLSLLLLAAAIWLDSEDQPIWAGVAAAHQLFKPQFGVVLVPLMIVGRRWRMLVGWAAGAAVLYIVSRLLMGGAWLADWWEQAGAFRDLNVIANGDNFVSFPGFLENMLGVGSATAWVVGYGLAAVIGVAVAYYWWSNPRSYSLERWALAAAAVVLAAPQTLYYDTGLLLLGLVVFLEKERSAMVIGGFVLLSWTQLASAPLGWSPLGPLSWVAVGALLVGLLRRDAMSSGAAVSD